MVSPKRTFSANLELVNGQKFDRAFIDFCFEQKPEYVQRTNELADELRSNIKPTSTQPKIAQIKQKYRPLIKALRAGEKRGIVPKTGGSDQRKV